MNDADEGDTMPSEWLIVAINVEPYPTAVVAVRVADRTRIS